MKVNPCLNWLFSTSILVSIFISGCSSSTSTRTDFGDLPRSDKTNEELISKYKAQNDKLLADLKDIAKLLPKPGKTSKDFAVTHKLKPLPANTTEDTANIELMMEKVLQEPYAYMTDFNKHVEPDVDYSYALTAWQLNSFKNIQEAAKKKAQDKATKVSEETLAKGAPRYLGVIRVEDYAYPQLTSDNKFVKGHFRYRIFLVDLANKKILGSYSGNAESSAELTAEMKEDDSEDRKIEVLKQDLVNNTQIAISEQLAKFTGGDISKPSRQSVYYH